MAKEYEGKIEQIDQYRWRLPQRGSMRTDGIIFADEELFAEIKGDGAPWQVANVACMPGIVGSSLAMPDCHYGYGFPIGGVAAFDTEEGVISPGGVGYDINCGVRLLRTNLTHSDVKPHLSALTERMFSDIPAGVGKKSRLRLNDRELDALLTGGVGWAISQGYGVAGDVDAVEDRGCLVAADPSGLSSRARQRALPQTGTLGSGNHFLEIQVVDEIYDSAAAGRLGISEPGQVTVMIHTGSRGFGHQVCDDALDVMQKAVRKYNIDLPDRQLACAPIDSPEGQRYFAHMACAANYAWVNRQIITHWVREAFEKVLREGSEKLGMVLVADVTHNIAKFEEHRVNGQTKRLCVHRKGATRSLGPGHPLVQDKYRDLGQPVLIPGDMGTASYLLLGTQTALKESWGSTCHGAGRRMSRTAAKKRKRGEQVIQELKEQGILVRAAGKKTVAEEMPEAYKDVDRVVEVAHNVGLSHKVARLRPLAVVKG